MAAPCKRNLFSGRSVKNCRSTGVKEQNTTDNVLIDHNYEIGYVCELDRGCDLCFPGVPLLARSRKISLDEWKTARRVVELDTLVRGLSSCSKFRMGLLYLI